MEKNTQKKLLYYENFRKVPRHYNGVPIFLFMCKDVKTGENITLGSCFFHQEIKEILGEYFYKDITDATNDYDILWNLSNEVISPITATFEDVQIEYKRMLKEGISLSEINTTIMKLFINKGKSKSLN